MKLYLHWLFLLHIAVTNGLLVLTNKYAEALIRTWSTADLPATWNKPKFQTHHIALLCDTESIERSNYRKVEYVSDIHALENVSSSTGFRGAILLCGIRNMSELQLYACIRTPGTDNKKPNVAIASFLGNLTTRERIHIELSWIRRSDPRLYLELRWNSMWKL